MQLCFKLQRVCNAIMPSRQENKDVTLMRPAVFVDYEAVWDIYPHCYTHVTYLTSKFNLGK